jgi:Bacteriodetes cell division protein (FtsL-like)
MTKNKIIEKKPIEERPELKSGKGNVVTRTVGSLLSGSFLSKEQALRSLPFLLFLTVVALFYISNGYYAEEQIRKLNRLSNDLKELRSEFIISTSDVMFISKQSEVARRSALLGIKESVEPPIKIMVTSTDIAAAQDGKQ